MTTRHGRDRLAPAVGPGWAELAVVSNGWGVPEPGATPAILLQLTALVVAGAVVADLRFRLGLVPIVAFLLTSVAIGPNAPPPVA